MHKVYRSAIVPYSAEQMYTLAADVESYPEFLPWCRKSHVDSEQGDIIEATLQIHRGALNKSFRTRNRMTPFERIDIGLLGGTFRRLAGGWTFHPLGDEGCRVELTMEFEFENTLLEMMFGRYFEDVITRLVDAFTRRAESVYGGD